MKQVFFAEPVCDGSMPNYKYEVIRLNALTGERLKTGYIFPTQEKAEEKAHELNVEYNEQP